MRVLYVTIMFYECDKNKLNLSQQKIVPFVMIDQLFEQILHRMRNSWTNPRYCWFLKNFVTPKTNKKRYYNSWYNNFSFTTDNIFISFQQFLHHSPFYVPFWKRCWRDIFVKKLAQRFPSFFNIEHQKLVFGRSLQTYWQ